MVIGVVDGVVVRVVLHGVITIIETLYFYNIVSQPCEW